MYMYAVTESIARPLQIASREIYLSVHHCCLIISFNRLFYSEFKKTYGAPNGEAMMKQVEEMVQNLNEHQIKAKFKQHQGQMIVAFLTPLMERVHHSVRHSGEMVFMDSSGTMDRFNCRVFLLLTHSCAGGLPLGCLVTTSEAQEVLQHALELYTSLLDDTAFNGRGREGPAVFLTDDCRAERQALHAVFPNSTLLLCVFHVLQAYWRYLWDSKHGVAKSDRPHLFFLLKSMVYAETEEQLTSLYEHLLRDKVVNRYISRGISIVSLKLLSLQLCTSERTHQQGV